jgi:pantetheine-phosphate adenylyltransferase
MTDNSRIAIYPGSFDPVTNGHVDIAQRATHIFDKVIVAVSHNPQKEYLFTEEERLEMTRETFKENGKIRVIKFSGLVANLARDEKAVAIVRGLRAVSDFEAEFQLALMNRKMNRNVETVFLMTSFKYVYLSSSIIKDAAQHHGKYEDLVPPVVMKMLKQKYAVED